MVQLLIGHDPLQGRHDMPSLMDDFPKCLIVGEHRIRGQLWTDAAFGSRSMADDATGFVQLFASPAVWASRVRFLDTHALR